MRKILLSTIILAITGCTASTGIMDSCVDSEQKYVDNYCKTTNLGGSQTELNFKASLNSKIQSWKDAGVTGAVSLTKSHAAIGQIESYNAKWDFLTTQVVFACKDLSTCQYRSGECKDQRQTFEKQNTEIRTFLASVDNLPSPLPNK